MIERMLIAPNTYLNLIETDKFKCSYLSVNFLAKLSRKTAAANALLPRVMTRSCEKYPTAALLNRRFDELYSSSVDPKLGKNGDVQNFGFSGSFLRNEYTPDNCDILSGVLDLFEEMIFRPKLTGRSFDPDDVNIEKSNLKEKIAAKINNKMRYALSRASEIMFADEVYGIESTGSTEDVDLLTPESIYEDYEKMISEYPAEIYFIGSCDRNILIEKLKAMFAYRKESSPAQLDTFIIKTASDAKEVSEEKPVSQGNLVLGFRTGGSLSDSHYEYLSLLSDIYGGSATSKLFMNVREKLSLCYYCSSMIRLTKGVMFVVSGIEPANKEKALKEILAQLDSIRAGDISVVEFENAKLSLINACRALHDSPEALEIWYISRRLAGTAEDPEDLISRIRKAEISDVVEAAKGVTLDTVYFLRPENKEAAGNE
ncbi:MAG: insulinase family protein [Clostridia bacterium]|nr:insulinase family protein [Clostridia bacterium]